MNHPDPPHDRQHDDRQDATGPSSAWQTTQTGPASEHPNQGTSIPTPQPQSDSPQRSDLAGSMWDPTPTVPIGPPRPRIQRWIIALLAIALVGAAVTLVVLSSRSSGLVAGVPVPATTSAQPGPNPTTGGGAASQSAASEDSSRLDTAVPPFPTGVEYSRSDEIQIGECADIKSSDGGVVLYRANCADATVALDHIAETECPLNNYAGITRATGTHCFSWLLDVGDCISGDSWDRVPCTTDGAGPTDVITIVETNVGDTDGSSCEKPEQYVQWGRDDERGVACFLTLDQVGAR
jgi:hypothetical protein